MSPIASVVIPAHNEGRVIGRCLQRLLQGGAGDELEIVVVSNGSTDDTAVRAREFGVQVIELEQPSKAAALNAGDRAASAYPRIYLDADVEVEMTAVRELSRVLSQGERVEAAGIRPAFNLHGRPALVRAFYRAWQRTPFIRHRPLGNGVFGLSEHGRRRFDEFPDVLGDDYFVYSVIPPERQATIESVTFDIHPPRTLRSLLGIRTRVYAGNRQLVRSALPQTTPRDDSVGSALDLLAAVRTPRSLFDAVVYLGVNTVAKCRAVVRERRGGSAVWDRDNSTR